ncbi:SDR family oxidoreductase [Aeromicrobium sp.]|uniref:SDR family oxidoreductase n=1 Tax=Aeromicrobium sp. TaxID=1871063 RepID=UPI00199CFA74|nr:SDR family oxidoreductase [Aeromicrobium sp.]MBC7631857.1 SDR family oxidoreductase [Aeromicrobium sp.]
MSRIAIVGGHGNIARLLIPLLAEAGHQPLALVRDPGQAPELERLGAEVAIVDIEKDSAEAFAEAFRGADAIVFAAGGGGDGNIERKKTVDLGGSLKSIEGATIAGVKRFVQISAISVDEPLDADAGESWVAYVEAKRDADIALRGSELDWTIIRPGGLTDEAPTGMVTLAESVDRAQVPRADVAAVIAAVLATPSTIGKQWELISGDTPIAEALTH